MSESSPTAATSASGAKPSTILVADDMPIIREPIAAALRGAGYRVVCAANGKEALALVASEHPDLILLDWHMPELDGLGVLQGLQSTPPQKRPPVILLTADADREQVVEAARLGAREYLLKKSFSLSAMLARVAKCLSPQPQAAPLPAAPARPASAADPDASPGMAPSPSGPLLTRDQCLARAEHALTARALPGVVAQVIAMAASPRSSTADLADLIARDPMLCARVLQVANSAAYGSGKGVITTVQEAVRRIGSSALRNIAVAASIFEAMPQGSFEGFNPVRCWQHAFAVAQLCERLATMKDPALAALAYMVGLCHDLAEVLFRTHFAREYESVLAEQARTGLPAARIERQLLGATQEELATSILRSLQLPDAIREPIESAHRGDMQHPLARILRIADLYANGLMITASGASPVCPITKAECQAAAGAPDPAPPEPQAFRGEILALTTLLARLSPADARALATAPYPRHNLRVWLARERGLSAFDPIRCALESLADVDVFERLPTAAEASAYAALVICARSTSANGMTIGDVERAAGGGARLLWLIKPDHLASTPATPSTLCPRTWAIALDDLAKFISHCGSEAARPAA